MLENHVFVDFDNVTIPQSVPDFVRKKNLTITILVGPQKKNLDTALVAQLQEVPATVQLIRLEIAGKNAVDFALAFYAGRTAVDHPAGFIHLISRDKGFDPLIGHLRGRGVKAVRHISFAEFEAYLISRSSTAPAATLSQSAVAITADAVAPAVKTAGIKRSPSLSNASSAKKAAINQAPPVKKAAKEGSPAKKASKKQVQPAKKTVGSQPVLPKKAATNVDYFRKTVAHLAAKKPEARPKSQTALLADLKNLHKGNQKEPRIKGLILKLEDRGIIKSGENGRIVYQFQ